MARMCHLLLKPLPYWWIFRFPPFFPSIKSTATDILCMPHCVHRGAFLGYRYLEMVSLGWRVCQAGLVWGLERLEKMWVAGSRWLFVIGSMRQDGRASGLCLTFRSLWPCSWMAAGDTPVRSPVQATIWTELSEQPCGSDCLPPCMDWRLSWRIQTD